MSRSYWRRAQGGKAQFKEAYERQPTPDQELRPLVTPNASLAGPRPSASGHDRRVDAPRDRSRRGAASFPGPEHLEIHQRRDAFQAVTLCGDLRQPRINIKETRGSIRHVCVPPPNSQVNQSNPDSPRGFWRRPVLYSGVDKFHVLASPVRGARILYFSAISFQCTCPDVHYLRFLSRENRRSKTVNARAGFRELNDAFRTTLTGGILLFSARIIAKGAAFQ